MKENVYVCVKGSHSPDSGQMVTEEEYDEMSEENSGRDEIKIINAGKYKIINGTECIKYEEIDEDKNQTVNIIKINDKKVEIIKKGNVKAHMLFTEGKTNVTFYETPFGNMYMGITTEKIEIERDDSSISLAIKYSVEVNNEKVSDSIVEIKIQDHDSIEL